MNPNAGSQPPFAGFLGIKITHVSPDKVTAELPVREELDNRNGTLHGGAGFGLGQQGVKRLAARRGAPGSPGR